MTPINTAAKQPTGPPTQNGYPDYEEMRHLWQMKFGRDLSFDEYLQELEKHFQKELHESVTRIMKRDAK